MNTRQGISSRLLTLALAFSATLGGTAAAGDIRNGTPWRIEVSHAADVDNSVSGIADNGTWDSSQGLWAFGYFPLNPGESVKDVKSKYVRVTVWSGGRSIELGARDVAGSNDVYEETRSFPIPNDNSGFAIRMKFRGPTEYGPGVESRRQTAIRDAGYRTRGFVKLPDDGVIRWTPETKVKVENFLRANTTPVKR